MKKVRIGLIGVGGYGASHLDAIENVCAMGLAEFRAAVILPGMNLEEEAKLLNQDVSVYRSHEEMLEAIGGDLDLVGVPCGIDQHAPLSIACLDAGCNVLCEKPAAGDLEQALEMIRAEKRSGNFLAIGFQSINTPTLRRMKEISLSGEIGRLIKAKCKFLAPRASEYYDRNKWAGRLRHNGRNIYDSPAQNASAHFLHGLLWMAGPTIFDSGKPQIIYGENYRAKNIESADTQFLRIQTTEGVELTYIVTHAATEWLGPVVEFAFENGGIEWSAFSGEPVRVYKGIGAGAQLIEQITESDINVKHLPYIDACRSILDGTWPQVTIDNAIQHTECIDALFRDGNLKTVDSSYTETLNSYTKAEPSPITHITGIVPLVNRMYDEELSFFEAGAPWASPGRSV